MSKVVMDKMKAMSDKLDVPETAMLAAWLMKRVNVDTPMGTDGCPHFEKEKRTCEYPKVVE